jgi:hypothetical protein
MYSLIWKFRWVNLILRFVKYENESVMLSSGGYSGGVSVWGLTEILEKLL